MAHFAKRGRLVEVDTEAVVAVAPELSSAAAALDAERERNRKRAERFGLAYVEPNPFTAVTDVDAAKRLVRAAAGAASATVSGVNPFSPEEAARRDARSARFGTKPFDWDAARAEAAGLTEAEVRLRRERRERAAKFGVDDPLDVELAKAAVQALGSDGSSAGIEDPDAPPAQQPATLHMRGCGYLPVHTRDIQHFFGVLRPTDVQWLNAIAVNIHFADAATAARALEVMSEPVPVVKGVQPVHAAWRVCLKPVVKQRTDKYAPAGTETTVYLRFATVNDTPDKAARTTGPRTHGTFSAKGEYSLARVAAEEGGDEAMMGAPPAVAARDAGAAAAEAAPTAKSGPGEAGEASGEGAPSAKPPAITPAVVAAMTAAGVRSGAARVTSHVVAALRDAAKDWETAGTGALPSSLRPRPAAQDGTAVVAARGGAGAGKPVGKRMGREQLLRLMAMVDAGHGGESDGGATSGVGRKRKRGGDDTTEAARMASRGDGGAGHDGSAVDAALAADVSQGAGVGSGDGVAAAAIGDDGVEVDDIDFEAEAARLSRYREAAVGLGVGAGDVGGGGAATEAGAVGLDLDGLQSGEAAEVNVPTEGDV